MEPFFTEEDFKKYSTCPSFLDLIRETEESFKEPQPLFNRNIKSDTAVPKQEGSSQGDNNERIFGRKSNYNTTHKVTTEVHNKEVFQSDNFEVENNSAPKSRNDTITVLGTERNTSTTSSPKSAAELWQACIVSRDGVGNKTTDAETKNFGKVAQQKNKQKQMSSSRKVRYFIPKDRYPCLSRLTKEEQRIYLELYRKYAVAMFMPTTKDDMKEFHQYKELLVQVSLEQDEFMKYLEHVAYKNADDYRTIQTDVKKYIDEVIRNRMQRVYDYPQFYVNQDTVCISAPPKLQTAVPFYHIKTLLNLGTVPKVSKDLKAEPTRRVLRMEYEKVQKNIPSNAPEKHNKKVCSQDDICKHLSEVHNANVVISSSALNCLVNNHVPFHRQWEIPIEVREVTVANESSGPKTRKVVFIDKPLISKQMTVREQKSWYCKYALKSKFLYPMAYEAHFRQSEKYPLGFENIRKKRTVCKKVDQESVVDDPAESSGSDSADESTESDFPQSEKPHEIGNERSSRQKRHSNKTSKPNQKIVSEDIFDISIDDLETFGSSTFTMKPKVSLLDKLLKEKALERKCDFKCVKERVVIQSENVMEKSKQSVNEHRAAGARHPVHSGDQDQAQKAVQDSEGDKLPHEPNVIDIQEPSSSDVRGISDERNEEVSKLEQTHVQVEHQTPSKASQVTKTPLVSSKADNNDSLKSKSPRNNTDNVASNLNSTLSDSETDGLMIDSETEADKEMASYFYNAGNVSQYSSAVKNNVPQVDGPPDKKATSQPTRRSSRNRNSVETIQDSSTGCAPKTRAAVLKGKASRGRGKRARSLSTDSRESTGVVTRRSTRLSMPLDKPPLDSPLVEKAENDRNALLEEASLPKPSPRIAKQNSQPATNIGPENETCLEFFEDSTSSHERIDMCEIEKPFDTKDEPSSDSAKEEHGECPPDISKDRNTAVVHERLDIGPPELHKESMQSSDEGNERNEAAIDCGPPILSSPEPVQPKGLNETEVNTTEPLEDKGAVGKDTARSLLLEGEGENDWAISSEEEDVVAGRDTDSDGEGLVIKRRRKSRRLTALSGSEDETEPKQRKPAKAPKPPPKSKQATNWSIVKRDSHKKPAIKTKVQTVKTGLAEPPPASVLKPPVKRQHVRHNIPPPKRSLMSTSRNRTYAQVAREPLVTKTEVSEIPDYANVAGLHVPPPLPVVKAVPPAVPNLNETQPELKDRKVIPVHVPIPRTWTVGEEEQPEWTDPRAKAKRTSHAKGPSQVGGVTAVPENPNGQQSTPQSPDSSPMSPPRSSSTGTVNEVQVSAEPAPASPEQTPMSPPRDIGGIVPQFPSVEARPLLIGPKIIPLEKEQDSVVEKDIAANVSSNIVEKTIRHCPESKFSIQTVFSPPPSIKRKVGKGSKQVKRAESFDILGGILDSSAPLFESTISLLGKPIDSMPNDSKCLSNIGEKQGLENIVKSVNNEIVNSDFHTKTISSEIKNTPTAEHDIQPDPPMKGPSQSLQPTANIQLLTATSKDAKNRKEPVPLHSVNVETPTSERPPAPLTQTGSQHTHFYSAPVHLRDPKEWLMYEKPADYQQPGHGNATYNLWQVGKQRVLIRAGYHGFQGHGRNPNGVSFVHFQPKLEYQLHYGYEQQTLEEISKAWINLAIRNNCKLLRVHISGGANEYEESNIVKCEELGLLQVLQNTHTFNPQASVFMLSHVFDKLSSLSVGHYLLSHAPGNAHAHIKKTTQSRTGVYDITLAHEHHSVDSTSVPWIPIDPRVHIPFHTQYNRIPCTFEPKDSGYVIHNVPGTKKKFNAPGPRKKNKGKKKKKQVTST